MREVDGAGVGPGSQRTGQVQAGSRGCLAWRWLKGGTRRAHTGSASEPEVGSGWGTEVGTWECCLLPPHPCLEPPSAIGMECGAIKEPWWVRWPGSMQWTLVLVWEVPRPSLTCVPSAGDLVAEAAGAKPPPDSLMCSG